MTQTPKAGKSQYYIPSVDFWLLDHCPFQHPSTDLYVAHFSALFLSAPLVCDCLTSTWIRSALTGYNPEPTKSQCFSYSWVPASLIWLQMKHKALPLRGNDGARAQSPSILARQSLNLMAASAHLGDWKDTGASRRLLVTRMLPRCIRLPRPPHQLLWSSLFPNTSTTCGCHFPWAIEQACWLKKVYMHNVRAAS